MSNGDFLKKFVIEHPLLGTLAFCSLVGTIESIFNGGRGRTSFSIGPSDSRDSDE